MIITILIKGSDKIMGYVIAYQDNKISLYNNEQLIEDQTLLYKGNEQINNLISVIQACSLALKNNTLVFSMVGWNSQASEYIEKLFGKSFSLKFKYANENQSFWLNRAQEIIKILESTEFNTNRNKNFNSVVKNLEAHVIFLFAGIQKVYIQNKNAICIRSVINPVVIGYYNPHNNLDNSLTKYNVFTDASVRPQEKVATIACTVIDENNQVIANSRSLIDYEKYKDSNNAEIYSISKSLELIHAMNIKEVNIFTDSSCAVDKIKHYSPYCSGLFKESVQLVIEQAQALKSCTLTHIPRELNTFTDNLTHF